MVTSGPQHHHDEAIDSLTHSPKLMLPGPGTLMRGTMRSTIRRPVTCVAGFAAVIGGILLAVLTLTSRDAKTLLLRRVPGTAPVQYYFIPSAVARAGQILADSGTPPGAGNSTNTTSSNTTNGTNLTRGLPPYNELTQPPSAECDMTQMYNCLGALEARLASIKTLDGSDAETAQRFCTSMNEPFQCACRSCKLDQLGQWDYMFYHSNVTARAKQVLATMRVDAQCKKLRQIGAKNFPAGHGCNLLYETVCIDPQVGDLEPRQRLHEFIPFDSKFCPRYWRETG